MYCPLRQRLMELEVGYGFLITDVDARKTAVQALTYAAKSGIKVVTRKVNGGLQISRIR